MSGHFVYSYRSTVALSFDRLSTTTENLLSPFENTENHSFIDDSAKGNTEPTPTMTYTHIPLTHLASDEVISSASTTFNVIQKLEEAYKAHRIDLGNYQTIIFNDTLQLSNPTWSQKLNGILKWL